MKYILAILGETGGAGLLLSGQTGHGRAGRSVLFSLCGSPEKVQDGVDIILRSLLIGVVAAFGKNRQLAPRKAAVKSCGLFHVEDGAPVGIEHQGGTAHGRQDRPKIKIVRSVSSAILGKLIVMTLCRCPVPIHHLDLQPGVQISKFVYKPVPVELSHGNLAITLGAGNSQGFNLLGIFNGIVNTYDTAFALSNQMAFFDVLGKG
jgi:hypothetical protein